MPISKAKPVPTGQQEKERVDADVLRRRLMRQPTVEHFYKNFENGVVLHKEVNGRANVHHVGDEIEVNNVRFRIKSIERSTQGNVIHRIYSLVEK